MFYDIILFFVSDAYILKYQSLVFLHLQQSVYSSTVYHLIKISKEAPIWYTHLVKGTFICRAMEHDILELHWCRIWYAYS